jgi:aminoglycoside phosphotransferase (APT) family kinase protein
MIEHVRAALARHLPTYAVQTIALLGAGLEHVAFEVNGELVVRVSHDQADEAGILVEKEAALLAAVAKVSTLPVPAVVFTDGDAGILAYRKLPGVLLFGQAIHDPARFAADLGAFLSRLHTAPIAPFAALVPREHEPLQAWVAWTASDYEQVASQLPAAARRTIEAFLNSPPPPDPIRSRGAFCHNDLGTEHILVDPTHGTITGIVDWSDAAVTDPMRDFGRLYRDVGPAFTDALLATYTGRCTATDRARMVFYARCALVEDLAFGFATGASHYADAALAHLARTFA